MQALDKNSSTNASVPRTTILIVDDDTENLNVLGNLLRPHYDVLIAPSGARALQIAASTPKPDLIVLDVLMPDMDGYEVLARLHDSPASRDIPVIFVTGLDSTEDEEKGLKLGAVDYVTKPYCQPIILARVHTQLELKHARDLLANQNIHLKSEVIVAAETRSRLASIVELSDDAIVSTTLDGIVESWNKAAERLFGYSAKEAVGHDLKSLILPPEYASEMARKFDSIRRGKHIKHFETVRRRKDGTQFEVSIVASPILDAEEKIIGASVNIRDITERKRAEKALNQATDLLGARLKELECLYAISTIITGSGLLLDQRIQCVVEKIPSAFQYPEVACVRINLNGRQYKTEVFKETPWRIVSTIGAGDEDVNGELEVFYLEERPASDEGPFLREEVSLVNTVAHTLGDFWKRDLARSQLQLFRNLVDESDDSVFLIASDTGCFLDVNKRACTNLGYSSSELLHMCVTDVETVLPDALAWSEHVKAVKESGFMLMETMYKRKDGSTFPVEVSLKYVFREKNDYIIAIARDISERRIAEEALRESEARFRTLSDHSLVGVDIIQDDRFIYVNSAFAEVFGYQPNELIGASPSVVIHPDDQALVAEQIRRRIAGEEPVMHYEFRGRQKNGETRDIEVFSTQTMLNNRPAIVANLLDVTERKHAEQILKNEKTFSETLIQSLPDIFLLIDRQGSLLQWNKKLEDLTGLSPEEMSKVNVLNYVHEEDRSMMAQKIQQVFETGSAEAETRLNLKNGTRSYALTGNRVETQFGVNVIGIGIDITERKRAEELLKNMAGKYFTVFESSSDAILLLDKNGLVFDCNKATLLMFGCTTHVELVGKYITQFFPPTQPDGKDSASLAHERIAAAYQTGSNRFEWVYRRLDGVDFPSEVLLTIMDLDGKPMLQATVRDISERKRAQISEERYRRLFESAKDGILILDAETGMLVDANPYITELLGHPLEDCIGKNIWDLGCMRTVAINQEQFQELQRQEYTHYEDLALETATGKTIHVEFISNTYLVGKTKVVQCNFRDITERRTAEEQVNKLLLAVEQSPESIVITDLDASIEYVNDAFLKGTGYNREEVIGRNPRILQSGKTPHEAYDAMWDAMIHGQHWNGEFINRRKDGSEYTESVSIAPLRQADGHISHYVAVKEDITEKKRLADELDRHRHHLEELVEIRTHELEEAKLAAEMANAAKSTFVANMSHEIRTPLNAIIGLTHLLRRGYADPLQRERLDKIIDASRHLLAVINDILDFSKIEAGKLHLSIDDFAVDRMLDNVSSMIGPKVHEKRLDIVVERNDVPPVLVGDSTRLAQALLNYLSNAVKFTEHGKITVRISGEEETESDLLVRFEVTDTGIGIEPAKIADLFAAFEQVDATISRRYGGTGLGLAITQRLSHLMGGDVGAQSVPGQGSTFWFTARLGKSKLSVNELAASLAVPELGVQFKPLSARILLVEDNKINQEVAVALLSELGITVEVANNGYEALEKMRGGGYDLILMDMQMPGMDGLEATRAIRALPECATLPIIAMTANVFEEDRERCKAAGMNDFVAKPVDPAQLFSTLSRWLPTMAITPPAAPAEAGALPSPLAAIPGLDAVRGLKVLNGQIAAYQRLLRRYATEHADDMARLHERIASGDRDEARRLAHSLKGSSGNLGATDVQRMAAELETAIKDGRDASAIAPLASTLESELGRLMAAILSALPEEDAAPHAGEVDWTKVREVLTELEPFLMDSSMQANQSIEKHASLLKAALGPLGEELEQQIEHFLYPDAVETLKRARKENPELTAE